MADQRPFSRFRLPWVTARPTAEPQPPRPTVEIQAPPQPTTLIPQRTFRPGLASVQSAPPQIQAPQPPLATTESQVSFQPASTARTGAGSVPTSPSRTSSPPRATSDDRSVSQIRLPFRADQQSRAGSMPSSPTGTTSPRSMQQTVTQPKASSDLASQLTGRSSLQPSIPPVRTTLLPTVSQPPSPPKKSQSITQEVSQPPPISVQPQPYAYERKPEASLPAQSMKVTVEKEKDVEGTQDVEKQKKEGKTEEESMKNAISELLNGSQSKKPQQQEKEDKKATTIGSQGEHIKTASSTHPKARSKSTESHQKPSMSKGEQVPLHKEIRDDILKFIHKLGTGQIKYPTDEKPVSIVTVAGENTGASMHVGAEAAQKDEPVLVYGGYKLNPDDSTEATTDGERTRQGKRSENLTEEDPATKAYVNSNTQSINNSIVFDSSVTEQNPGVHLVLSHNPAEPNKPFGKPETLETRKAEFSITPAQKLTYEPTIRRRCLKGLFSEPSDSDDDDPEKPRRHGCRYSYGEIVVEKDIGVL